jgi:UDPglucose 6-dehydrogenase
MTVIGIVGLGFVGKAVQSFFAQKDCMTLRLYDKYRNIGSLQEILETDIVFLCLPTPLNGSTQRVDPFNGSNESKDSLTLNWNGTKVPNGYDLSALHETCLFLKQNLYNGVVLIKSTVLPQTCRMLSETYSLSIMHNPEFLTARTAERDFANQRHVVLGITYRITETQLETVKELYQTHFPQATLSVTSSDQSEAMKVFCNSFYAVKIQLFNEFYLLCQKLGFDYNETRDMMIKNGWINRMHTDVPGPDGQLSYGGACFVKDTQALLGQMLRTETPCAVLEAAVSEQRVMRS